MLQLYIPAIVNKEPAAYTIIFFMKALFSLLFIGFFAIANGQAKDSLDKQPDPTKKLLNAEAACGQCKFGLKGTGCTLAVRVDGKAYFVDGTDIDSHGDAHADDGFCNAIKKAQVQGAIVNDRFKATYFKLVKP